MNVETEVFTKNFRFYGKILRRLQLFIIAIIDKSYYNLGKQIPIELIYTAIV
jgi:hypothetical protein